MPLRFTVLASGSGGNASLLQADGLGVLIDAGLGPRQLAWRLRSVGLGWEQVHLCLLTHTHGDHWRERTFAHLHRLGIPLYCHADHHPNLLAYGPSFTCLLADRLVRSYHHNESLSLCPSLRCRPLALRHDSEATFGFRFEHVDGTSGCETALAYLADLGCWSDNLLDSVRDVDLLALEFNHDVEMEYTSGRSPYLVRRVLGDQGHLSNEQAADLLRHVLVRSEPDRLKHVVLLHLSRDCNRPELAQRAARAALQECGSDAAFHTSCQHSACSPVWFTGPVRRAPAQAAAWAETGSTPLLFPEMM